MRHRILRNLMTKRIIYVVSLNCTSWGHCRCRWSKSVAVCKGSPFTHRQNVVRNFRLACSVYCISRVTFGLVLYNGHHGRTVGRSEVKSVRCIGDDVHDIQRVSQLSFKPLTLCFPLAKNACRRGSFFRRAYHLYLRTRCCYRLIFTSSYAAIYLYISWKRK